MSQQKRRRNAAIWQRVQGKHIDPRTGKLETMTAIAALFGITRPRLHQILEARMNMTARWIEREAGRVGRGTITTRHIERAVGRLQRGEEK